jgi:hypothetical protein
MCDVFYKYFLTLCLLLVGWHSFAVEIELSQSRVQEGESIELLIHLENRLDRDIVLPDISGANISRSGSSTSVSIINGSYSKKTTYSFSISVEAKGTYTIASFPIYTVGKKYMTKPISFAVVGNEDRSGSNSSKSASSTAFMKRVIRKKEFYIGEPFLVETKFYFRSSLAGAEEKDTKSPDFRYIDLKKHETREELDGMLYNVIIIRQILIPTRSGDLQLPAQKITAAFSVPKENYRRRNDFFSDFFGSSAKIVKRVLSTKKDSLKIKPIPLSRPNGYIEAIGSFKVSVALSSKEIKLGDSSTLTVIIEGYGVLDSLSDLKLKFADNIKIYTDKPILEEKLHSSKGLYSKKIFKYALVPDSAGDISLGKWSGAYFDPNLSRFVDFKKDLGRLNIVASDREDKIVIQKSNNNSLQQNSVKSIGSDLIDIHRNSSFVHYDGKSYRMFGWYFWFFCLLFTILVIDFCILFLKRNLDVTSRLSSRAFSRFKKESKSFYTATMQEKDMLTYYGLYKVYLGDKFGRRSTTLTAKDIELFFAKINLSEKTLTEAKKIAHVFDRFSFAGDKFKQSSIATMKKTIDQIVREIEKNAKLYR